MDGSPGIMGMMLVRLVEHVVGLSETADSEFSRSVLKREADRVRAGHTLHEAFHMVNAGTCG